MALFVLLSSVWCLKPSNSTVYTMYFHLHGTVTVIDFIHKGKNSTTGCVSAEKVAVLLQCIVDDLHHVKYSLHCKIVAEVGSYLLLFSSCCCTVIVRLPHTSNTSANAQLFAIYPIIP